MWIILRIKIVVTMIGIELMLRESWIVIIPLIKVILVQIDWFTIVVLNRPGRVLVLSSSACLRIASSHSSILPAICRAARRCWCLIADEAIVWVTIIMHRNGSTCSGRYLYSIVVDRSRRRSRRLVIVNGCSRRAGRFGSVVIIVRVRRVIITTARCYYIGMNSNGLGDRFSTT